MKNLRLLPLLLIPILLAGCAPLTTHQRAVLQAHEVAPAVYNKMMAGDPLTLPDIAELSRRAVPPGMIVDYLRDTGASYRLRKPDVTRLRNAGVDESVIAYLLSTSPQYPGPYYGGAYYGGTGYYGPGYYPGVYPYDPYYYSGPAIFAGGGYYGRWHGGDRDWHERGGHERGGHEGGGHEGGGHHHH